MRLIALAILLLAGCADKPEPYQPYRQVFRVEIPRRDLLRHSSVDSTAADSTFWYSHIIRMGDTVR